MGKEVRTTITKGVLNELEFIARAVEDCEKTLGCIINLRITRVAGEFKQAPGVSSFLPTTPNINLPNIAKTLKPGESYDLRDSFWKKDRG